MIRPRGCPTTHPGPDPGRWRVALWAGDVGVRVDLTLGHWAGTGSSIWRRVHWDPGRWLWFDTIPSFSGDLGLRTDGSGNRIVLKGDYQPPGGLVGWLGDRLILRRVAHHTGRRLADGIADRLARAAVAVAGERDDAGPTDAGR